MGGFGSGNSGFSPSQNIIPGSTKWGTALTDTHQVTGSVDITGSLEVSGSVAIGTASPANPLTVTPTLYDTGTASQAALVVTGVGTTWTAAMIGSEFVYADGTSSGAITAFTDATHLTVTTSQTVGSQAYAIKARGLQVASDGKVGVGTETPTAQLHISSSVAGLENLLFRVDHGNHTSDNPIMSITGSGLVGIGTAYPSAALNIQDDGLAFLVESEGGSDWFKVQSGAITFNSAGGQTFAGGVDLGQRFNIVDAFGSLGVLGLGQYPGSAKNVMEVNSNHSDNGGDWFVIDQSGSVGIGVTDPLALLHISGSDGTDAFRVDTQGAQDNPAIFVEGTNSYVGIGTDAPSQGLHIKDNGGGQIVSRIEGSAGRATLQVDNGTNYTFFGASSAGLDFAAGGSGAYSSPQMTLRSTGELGIGITNPTELLDVAGTANATALSVGGVAITSTPAELNLLDASTVTAPSEGIWTGLERVAVINIGASEYALGAHVLGVTLPDNAIITRALLDITTAFVAGATTEMQLATTGNVHSGAPSPIDFLGGPASVSMFGAEEAIALSPLAGKLNGASTLTCTVSAADPAHVITAGNMNIYVYYIMGS